MKTKIRLSANTIKLIAVLCMTADHLCWVFFPGYSLNLLTVFCHFIGRVTEPLMCYFIVEGYFHTRSVKKYLCRLLVFALISHIPYCLCFGIPLLPFSDGRIFGQTGIMLSLAAALAAVAITESKSPKLKPIIKFFSVFLLCIISLPADWCCVPVISAVFAAKNRADFTRQMLSLCLPCLIYAVIFIRNPVYAVIQTGCLLSAIPLYFYENDIKPKKSSKWFFYIFYPAHLLAIFLLSLI